MASCSGRVARNGPGVSEVTALRGRGFFATCASLIAAGVVRPRPVALFFLLAVMAGGSLSSAAHRPKAYTVMAAHASATRASSMLARHEIPLLGSRVHKRHATPEVLRGASRSLLTHRRPMRLSLETALRRLRLRLSRRSFLFVP